MPNPLTRRLGVAVVGLGQAIASDTRKLSEKNQFALEMDAFAEAIRADRAPRTPGEEGLQDLRLIEAIYRAAGDRRHRPPAALDRPRRHARAGTPGGAGITRPASCMATPGGGCRRPGGLSANP